MILCSGSEADAFIDLYKLRKIFTGAAHLQKFPLNYLNCPPPLLHFSSEWTEKGF